MANKIFTHNEAVALMHEDTAEAFRMMADFIEKWDMEKQEIIAYMIEIADAKDAQSIVTKLRDEINP